MATASQMSEVTALLAENGRQAEEQTMANEAYGTVSDEVVKKDPNLTTTWKAESKILAKYSTPLFATYLLQYSSQTVTVLVAGHIGTKELGAVSLASMTANVTALAVYEGLATSLDTLCAQSFGSGKPQLVGLHLQRMVYLMLLATIPIGAVWIASPWILEAMIPERDIAHLAGRYLQVYLIGAPGFAIFEASKRLVQAQGDFTGPLFVLSICAPVNVVLNFLFVWQFKLGFLGAPLAAAVSNNLQPLILIAYIRFIAPSNLQCWPGLSKSAFRNWGPMIRLALPGVMMTFCEWLAFDILTFASSYLSPAHLAAQCVLMTVCVLIYHIPFPVSIAASTRFGNLIGHGALAAARVAARTYAIFFVAIGLFDITLLVSLKESIPKLFTPDPEVQAKVSEVMPVVAAAQFFDATTALANALVRGLGRQVVGGWLTLAVYYVFAVPLSLILAFGPPKMGLAGLWVGPCSGLALITLVEGPFIKWTSWQRAVDDARRREE